MGKSNSLEDIAVGFDDEACLEIDNGIEKVYCIGYFDEEAKKFHDYLNSLN